MQNHKKVICFPSPKLWTFYDFVLGDTNPIENWYQGLSEEGQLNFDALLKIQQKTESHLNWIGFKYLQGKPKQERVWQLDFIADKRQYRVLGVFGRGSKGAVLVLGCYHKGETYTPHEALETARQRAKLLREGKAGIRERKINTDF